MRRKLSPSLNEHTLSETSVDQKQMLSGPNPDSHNPRLSGKRVAMVVFSQYPADPRPRRAADALIEEGVEVDLLCERGSGSNARESLGMLNVTRIPVGRQRGGIGSYAYQYSTFILFSTVILAWRTLRKRYDLIYVHNMPDILVICSLIPKLFGAKVILDQHDPMPELMTTIFHVPSRSRKVQFLCTLEKWSLKRANRVITVNEACRNLFSSRGCPKEKIQVVMNSPDERLFSYRAARSYQQPASDAPFVIMYHGSLVERNGLGLAVAALVRLREHMPRVELRVYGNSTSYLEQVLKEATELGVQDCIHYLGGKHLEEIASAILECNVGIIPNQRNAFTDINTPTRIFEYLALGKPVVAPSTRGILDYFGPDELYYFAPGDSESMANAIRSVAADWKSAVAYVERGQKVYLRHTWQQEKKTLLKSVCELVSQDAAPATEMVEDLEQL